MQTARVLVLAVLALGAGAARRSTAAVSQAAARAWLQSHGPAPQKDELSDLKAENPEAYAIVKALLTKRSLGLLDPRHPSASFAPNAQPAAEPHMSSVDFAASVGVTDKASQQASSAAEPADDVEVPPPVHHAHKDWLNWRPADSAAEDDTQVQQVLGAVTQLKSGDSPAATSLPASVPQPLVESAPAIPAAAQPVSVPAIPAAEQQQQQQQQQPAAAAMPTAPTAETAGENHYLKGMDLGAPAQKPTAAEAPQQPHENAYLKGLDLGGSSPKQSTEAAAPAAVQQGLVGVKQAVSQGSNNRDYLKDFSWSDDAGSAFRAAAEDHPLPPAHIVTQDEALPAARVLTPFGQMPAAPAANEAATTAPPRKQNALVSWLGSSWGPVQSQPDAQKKTAALQSSTHTRGAGRYSSYLKGLLAQ